MLELVVNNLINSEPTKLAAVGVKAECRKCGRSWEISLDKIFQTHECTECTRKKQESGTG